jgi:hypothetical protein
MNRMFRWLLVLSAVVLCTWVRAAENPLPATPPAPAGEVKVTAKGAGPMRVPNQWGSGPIEVVRDTDSDLQDEVPFTLQGSEIVFEAAAGEQYIIRLKQSVGPAGVETAVA